MNQALMRYISSCPSAYHAVEQTKLLLRENGYSPLDPSADTLQAGGKYYYEKDGGSLFAFRIPQTRSPGGFLLVAAHGDSPAFKLKHSFFLEKGPYCCLNTERYGGMDLHSWFDRPLALAGRVILREGGKLVSRTVDSKEAVALIPSVAGHLLKDKGSPDLKCDLIPLYSQGSSDRFWKRLGVNAEVLGADLFLYSLAEPVVWGENGEFISAPRLDDLQCVFAALQGFLKAPTSSCIPVLCLFDNEEVGSGTKQGAASNTLLFLLQSVAQALGCNPLELFSRSFALSADNAHGVHPNHPELNDAKDRPLLNGGVVLKFNANQRYTTDGLSQALVEDLAQRTGIPLQYYSNRSDLLGGSTLGNLLVRSLPIDCADIGLAQLSMHSTVETAGAKDTEYMAEFIKHFYSSATVREEGLLQWSKEEL